jgi:hypothetical protein
MAYFRNSFFHDRQARARFHGWLASRRHVGRSAFRQYSFAVLAILEISLSFDNAVVNASVLKEMSPVWRRRFLTWGIAIAVFGMRIVFPLIIVAISARIDPMSALVMAATDPEQYSRVLTGAHISVAAFGGAFLAMVGLKHFFNHEKDVHWIAIIERPLTRLGRIEALEIGLVLLLLYLMTRWLGETERVEFLVAGIFGLLTYITVDGIAAVLNVESTVTGSVTRSARRRFYTLKSSMPASASRGVIGAFALSKAFRHCHRSRHGRDICASLTILLVERQALASYRFLEHGAFCHYRAGVVMQTPFSPSPKFTGLIGGSIIVAAFWTRSVTTNARAAPEVPDHFLA